MPDKKRPGQKKKNIRMRIFPESQVAEVTFTLKHSGAHAVYLCGDFNQWTPGTLPLARSSGGDCWERRLILPTGVHQYKFVVDGEWMADPANRREARNSFGSVNSVLEVPLARDGVRK